MSGGSDHGGDLVGSVLELEVGEVAHGGHCIARHDGQVVFVRHAVPGERVRAQVTEQRRGYLRADAVEILRVSPDRVTPPCPYAGPGRCGGCDFQHVDPAAIRRLKATVVAESLIRLGGLSAEEVAALNLVVEELPGGAVQWRERVQYAVDPAGRVGFRRYRSHEVIPIDRCRIAVPEIQQADVTSRRWPGVSTVEVIAVPGEPVTVLTRQRRHSSRGMKVVRGARRVRRSVLGREWTMAPDAFWQAHRAAAERYATALLELLKPRIGERVWDLYGGAGLFTATLADAIGPTGAVTLVEVDPRTEAERNLADLPQARVVRGRVERVLAAGELGPVDLVVLDPPRAGAGADVVAAISAAAPRAVAYLACDPAALARDVKEFRQRGWRLATLRAFDAFPMTHHVECLALFEPRDSAERHHGADRASIRDD